MSSEVRNALGARKARRPHPASPEAVGQRHESRASTRPEVKGPAADEQLVMLYVRVSRGLWRRLKLVAASTGLAAADARRRGAQSLCKKHDM